LGHGWRGRRSRRGVCTAVKRHLALSKRPFKNDHSGQGAGHGEGGHWAGPSFTSVQSNWIKLLPHPLALCEVPGRWAPKRGRAPLEVAEQTISKLRRSLIPARTHCTKSAGIMGGQRGRHFPTLDYGGS